MKKYFILALFFIGCSGLKGATPSATEAVLSGFVTPCDQSLLLAKSKDEEWSSSLIVPIGNSTTIFKFESHPELGDISSSTMGLLCADTVSGSISFDAVSGRYYRPYIGPGKEKYEVELYESLNRNGVPGKLIESKAEIAGIKRHCKFYPGCSFP